MKFFSNKKENKIKKPKRIILFGISKEKEYFFENLSMLVSSGMSIYSALDSISRGVKSSGMKTVTGRVRDEVDSGKPIWEALRNVGIFSDYVVSLVRIGEKSGRLVENLNIIVSNQRKERDFKDKVRSAMMYPALVMILAVTIGIGVAWFILPKLADVFSQLRVELPWMTKVLIAAGDFLHQYGFFAVFGFITVVTVLIYFIFFFRKTRYIGYSIIFRTPILRDLVKEIELSRAGFILGSLMNSGLPVVDAIHSLMDISEFREYRKFYTFLGESIEKGNTFENSFNSYRKMDKLINPSIQQMIISGERSGNLAGVLQRIGEVFEIKTESTTKNLSIILEPFLLVIVWIAVLFVALSVIMPIYSLLGGLDREISYGGQSEQQVEVKEEVTPGVVTEEVEVSQEQSTETPTEETDVEQVGAQEEIIVLEVKRLVVLDNETGYLNVRENGYLESSILTRINPGEEFEYTEERDGWYKIVYDKENKLEGWVFGQYVEVLENQ